MKGGLARKLIGPQLGLLVLISALSAIQLIYLTGERRTLADAASRLQRASGQLQLLNQDFADAERDLLSYRIRRDRALARHAQVAVAETEDVLQSLSLGEWSPRGRNLLRELGETYRLMVGLQAELIDTLSRGDEPAIQRAYVRWWLVAEKANAMLADLSAYNVRRLDTALADLHRSQLVFQWASAALTAIAAAAALLFWLYVGRRVVTPLLRLSRAAERVGNGSGGELPDLSGQRDEIGALAGAFAEMTRRLTASNEQLVQALASREQFISIAAHELKTPITSLQLQLQLFQRRLSEKGEPELLRQLMERVTEQAERQVRRLTSLVDELLDASRIQAGKLELHPEPVNVTALSRAVFERFAALFERGGNAASAEISEGLWCRCDAPRLDQVLVNLLSNAVKYAPAAPITLRAAAAGSTLRLTVEDGGPGVPEAMREEIFGRYVRASSEGSGLGLGLFICREIVAAHGGRLWVEPGTAGGARFVVELTGLIPPR